MGAVPWGEGFDAYISAELHIERTEDYERHHREVDRSDPSICSQRASKTYLSRKAAFPPSDLDSIYSISLDAPWITAAVNNHSMHLQMTHRQVN